MARARRRGRGGIRIHRNYSIDEAATITGYAKGTLRRKIKAGVLPAIVDRRPHLILGSDLADLLKPQRQRGPKLRLEECYCLKCRAPRSPALGMADYKPLTASTGNLSALCEVCGTVMHKAISRASLAGLDGVLQVSIQQADKRIGDTSDPSPDDHFTKEPKPDA